MAKYIYLDEAGTSAEEPVTVMGGILVDPDEGRAAANKYLDDLRNELPERIRDKFIFHSTDLFSGGKYRQTLDREHRWDLLRKLLQGPRACGLTIVFSYIRRDKNPGWEPKNEVMFRHNIAYLECLKTCNINMKDTYPNQTASVVVEDHPTMRRLLSRTSELLKNKEAPEFFRGPYVYDAIVDVPSFAQKKDAPLLQYADAVAFAVRHYLSRHKHGLWLLQALFGVENVEPVFAYARMAEGCSETIMFPGPMPTPWPPTPGTSMQQSVAEAGRIYLGDGSVLVQRR